MNYHIFVDENRHHLLTNLPNFCKELPIYKLKGQPSYGKLMKLFGQVLNEFEINLLTSALASQISIVHLTRSEYQQLTHLTHLNYIIPFGKNRYYLKPELLNHYNHYCLNNTYQNLPEFKPYIYNKLKFLAEVETLCRNYETLSFVDCLLEHFDTHQLQELCTLMHIKDDNHLSNAEKCQRISHKILNDYKLFDKLFEFLPMLKILFSIMIIENRNSFLGAEIDADKNNLFFLFSHAKYDLVYVPIDLFEHIKCYFKDRGIHAETYLCQSIHQFTGKQLSLEDEQKLVKGLCQNQLNRFLADTLLTELTKDVLYEDILDCAITELRDMFFVSLVSLYGFVPLTIVSQLYNRYFNKDETPESIKQILSLHPNSIYCVREKHLVFVSINDCYEELDQQYHQIPYYIPETIEELFEIISIPYYMQNSQFKSSYNYLCKHYPNDTSTSNDEIHNNTVITSLLFPLLTLDNKNKRISSVIQKWNAEGRFKDTSIRLLSKSILIIYTQLHLWSLRGHNTESSSIIRSKIQTNPSDSNVDKDV